MDGIATIVGFFVVVAALRFRCGYRYYRGLELRAEYGQQHVPSRNPLLLSMASGVLSIFIGIRLYAAMQQVVPSAVVAAVSGVVAFLLVFVAFTFFGELGGLFWRQLRLAAVSESEEAESRLLGFSSPAEANRMRAAALGYSSVEDMHKQSEAGYALIREFQEVFEQAKSMASSGVPIEAAIEAIGAEHAKTIRSVYGQGE